MLSVIIALILFGCFGTTYNFKIRFNDIQGLRDNDQVFFDKTPIGVVTDVEYTDTGNYLVSVAVEDKFSSLPKDSSTFYIDSNPENEGQEAVRIIQIKDGGNIIEKNTIVEGQSKYSAIYGQIANNQIFLGSGYFPLNPGDIERFYLLTLWDILKMIYSGTNVQHKMHIVPIITLQKPSLLKVEHGGLFSKTET